MFTERSSMFSKIVDGASKIQTVDRDRTSAVTRGLGLGKKETWSVDFI